MRGRKSPVDFCCTAACVTYDPTETQRGWRNGDVSLAGGWFAILFDGEERSSAYEGLMVIAHIDEQYLPTVRALPETVRFTVAAA